MASTYVNPIMRNLFITITWTLHIIFGFSLIFLIYVMTRPKRTIENYSRVYDVEPGQGVQEGIALAMGIGAVLWFTYHGIQWIAIVLHRQQAIAYRPVPISGMTQPNMPVSAAVPQGIKKSA